MSNDTNARDAFRNAYWTKHDREDFEKAQALVEDIETLRDPPESLREDVVELCQAEDYEDAKAKLEVL